MLEKDDWKIALEDARFRHNGILGLIHAADNQALSLLRLYVTIGIAAAAGAASVMHSQSAASLPLAISLVGAALVLAFGAWQCFSVIEGADINLPGRGADFWLWAANSKKDRAEIFREYLAQLTEKHIVNNDLNKRQTTHLRRAKLAGVLSPVVALLAGGAAALMQIYC